MDIVSVIYRCQKNEREAQNQLYERYAPLLYSIALRYMRYPDQAEDVLIQAFYKILDGISSYEGKGNFEGWMKRIVINESLMALRKKKNLAMTIPVEDVSHEITASRSEPLAYEELLALLDKLPIGYRTVFNLYAIEGYKHREIAEMLDISINTSKSQLILARRKLQEMIKKKVNFKIA